MSLGSRRLGVFARAGCCELGSGGYCFVWLVKMSQVGFFGTGLLICGTLIS
jgi:hypothetical protein